MMTFAEFEIQIALGSLSDNDKWELFKACDDRRIVNALRDDPMIRYFIVYTKIIEQQRNREKEIMIYGKSR